MELSDVPPGEHWKVAVLVGAIVWAVAMVAVLVGVILWRWPLFGIPLAAGIVATLLVRRLLRRAAEVTE